jgi:hypothetical protein
MHAQNECQSLGRERDELPAYVANYQWGLNPTPLDPRGGARDEWGMVDLQTILALDDRRPSHSYQPRATAAPGPARKGMSRPLEAAPSGSLLLSDGCGLLLPPPLSPTSQP